MIRLADLEAFLGESPASAPALLLELEAAAVDWFTQQTDRYWGEAAETTVLLEGNGQRDLYLPETPDAAEDILVVERSYPGDTETIIDSLETDGYELRDSHLARKGGYVWGLGYEYLVTFVRGYELVDEGPPKDILAPDAVRQAVKQIVAFWYHGGEPAEGASQKTSETMGNYSYTRGALFTTPDAMLNAIPGLRQTIANYRIPRI
jgi:hypothetical protein